jgi:predicted AlkP superfamily pyrophosphatase or phosphodiesterase
MTTTCEKITTYITTKYELKTRFIKNILTSNEENVEVEQSSQKEIVHIYYN